MTAFTSGPEATADGCKSKILSSAANGITAFISRHGADAEEILQSVGISESDTQKDRQILDLPSYCALLETASLRTRNDNFGLHYGRDFTPERLGLIGQIAIYSPTLADALSNLARYFPYHQQNTFTSFKKTGEFWSLEYRILDGFILQRRQDAELTMGMYLNILRRVMGPAWSPEEVHFEHPKPADWHAHEAVFDAPVYFNMTSNALVFREGRIARPVPGWNADRMNDLCHLLMQLTGGRGDLDVVQKTAGEIRARLPAGYPHIEGIAEELGMTRWTLQRRLADQGHAFSTLVEDTRRRLALLYLGQTHLMLSEVAILLGYSELSAFSRACARWFNAAPTEVRAGLVHSHADPSLN